MIRLAPLALLAGSVLVACGDPAPAAQTPPPATVPQGAPTPKPAPPAFKSGDPVVDRSGAPIGVVQSMTESRAGELVVVLKIDGKMVTAPQSELTLRPDGTAVSSRSKEQLLAAAGAPR